MKYNCLMLFAVIMASNHLEWFVESFFLNGLDIDLSVGANLPLVNELLKNNLLERCGYEDCCQVPKMRGSGIYIISINGRPKQVYCEVNPDGSKFMIIQRRKDGSQDFYNNWQTYEDGFGDICNEFWIGNNDLYELTVKKNYKLRIVMEANYSTRAYADYSTFSVGSPATNYKLNVDGYSGNAGDSLSYHNDQMFSTYDKDNDVSDDFNCASLFKGAWWYKACHKSNLNGFYYGSAQNSYADGVHWVTFTGFYNSLNAVTMKLYC